MPPLDTGDPNIVVINYESGNLRSVARAVEKAGVVPCVTSDPAMLDSADAVILPGVGSGPAAMSALNARGLVEPLLGYIASGRPFLGVCLGLQLLLEATDEGDADCIGLVPGRVRRLPDGMKVPHMGWNTVRFQTEHPLWAGIPQDSHFYFVHSYYADPTQRDNVAGVTEYGVPFCSVYARDNVVATQFHPEKSGVNGLRIYANFVSQAARVSG
ncbi:Imidazole glycerol phosphate synthase subunit HisH [Geodia barretti]|uniref:Imidazole glycerol phosphate synthase subunit HisH n=1 Tax=Geodia barretti TaxID=519541 RepID=A0AA35X2I3_GEOBA|nr:Imidazole glycerol phosphate synthase subunit HisH [Geodia barretti]